jgi:hypothetical protein
MKNKIKLFLNLWIILFTFLNANAQCETIIRFFKDDMYTSKELVAFSETNPQKKFDSWKVLHNEKTGLTKNIEELTLVSNNLNEIDKAGGYTKWKALESGGNILGKIVRNGNKIEYINPSDKILKWTEQGVNDIDNAISTAKNLDPLNTNNIGRITEGKVADFIKREGKTVEGFSLTIKKADNSVATDIDIITSNEIIEVKNNMAVWEKKPNQVNRFVNSSLEDFVNPHNKKAILYVEKPLSDLDKAKILNTIPKNVTLVNSLTELKTILK